MSGWAGRGKKGVRVMQQGTRTHPAGSPAAGTTKPSPDATFAVNEAWSDAPVPILEARAYPSETNGTEGAGAPPDNGEAAAKAAKAAAKAKRAKAAAAKTGAAVTGEAEKAKTAQGKAAKGKVAKGKAAKGKGGKSKVDVRTFVKIGAGILACLAIPPLVGEFLHVVFHVHKINTLLVTLALYPVFLAVIVWIIVRALFKPVANPDSKDLPLPSEAVDHGTRDDGSTLM